MRKYLPIGSIVRLKEGTKKIMIYGRRQTSSVNGEEYDYVACLYPEGRISDEYTYSFDESLIEELIFTGYTDEDDVEFCEYLNSFPTA